MSQKVARKKRMLEALESSLGVVSQAAEECGIDRRTHYRWMKEDEEYKEKVESLSDLCIDFAESQLFKQIKEGNTTATIFYLKTKGKKRGYIERQEIDTTIKTGMKRIDWRNGIIEICDIEEE